MIFGIDEVLILICYEMIWNKKRELMFYLNVYVLYYK